MYVVEIILTFLHLYMATRVQIPYREKILPNSYYYSLLVHETHGYYREAIRWRYINLAFKMDNFTQDDPALFMDV